MNSPTEVNAGFCMEQLLGTMINADRPGAAAMIGKAIAQGMPPERVIVDVLDPALVRLGALWGRESVSLAQTFVANAFQRVMTSTDSEETPD